MLRALAFLALVTPISAHAAAPIQDGGNFGVGFGGGAGVSGVSAKYFVGSDFAIQGMVGVNNPFAFDLLNTGYTRTGFAFEQMDVCGFCAGRVAVLCKTVAGVHGSWHGGTMKLWASCLDRAVSAL